MFNFKEIDEQSNENNDNNNNEYKLDETKDNTEKYQQKPYSYKKTNSFSVLSIIVSDPSCWICTRTLNQTKDGIIHLPCSHIFHLTCLFDWFSTNTILCPICNVVKWREKTYNSNEDNITNKNKNTTSEKIREEYQKMDMKKNQEFGFGKIKNGSLKAYLQREKGSVWFAKNLNTDITKEWLIENKVTINQLLNCFISIDELRQKGVITSIDDLLLFKFRLEDVKIKDSKNEFMFPISRLQNIFNINYKILSEQFETHIMTLINMNIEPNDLQKLQFNLHEMFLKRLNPETKQEEIDNTKVHKINKYLLFKLEFSIADWIFVFGMIREHVLFLNITKIDIIEFSGTPHWDLDYFCNELQLTDIDKKKLKFT